MPIFNMVGAGNGGEDLPIGSRIIVTSNEGAVIKCAKGTTSEEQTVPASGQVTFTVHMSGIWQLTATKTGETTKTKVITVVTDDTDYNVTMMFKLYLYNHGEEYSSITGGWNIGRNHSATLTKNTTNMVFKSNDFNLASGIIPLAFPLDGLSDFSTLNVIISSYTPVTSIGNYGLQIRTSRDFDSGSVISRIDKTAFESEISLPLSPPVLSGVVWIIAYYSEIAIEQVWLE